MQKLSQSLPSRRPSPKKGRSFKASGLGEVVSNWEGPYRIIEILRSDAYRLKILKGAAIPRT